MRLLYLPPGAKAFDAVELDEGLMGGPGFVGQVAMNGAVFNEATGSPLWEAVSGTEPSFNTSRGPDKSGESNIRSSRISPGPMMYASSFKNCRLPCNAFDPAAIALIGSASKAAAGSATNDWAAIRTESANGLIVVMEEET